MQTQPTPAEIDGIALDLSHALALVVRAALASLGHPETPDIAQTGEHADHAQAVQSAVYSAIRHGCGLPG